MVRGTTGEAGVEELEELVVLAETGQIVVEIAITDVTTLVD